MPPRFPPRRYDRAFDPGWVYGTEPRGVADAGLVPVEWDGLSLNTGDQGDGGLFSIIENVEGWLDSPPLNGNDAARSIADGSAWGPKTLGARHVTLHGAATGPRDQLGWLRGQLAARAAARYPAPLTITDGGLDRSLTADVRGGTEQFRQTWLSRSAFRWQVTLTAADPVLYDTAWRTARLSAETGEDTGRVYQREFTWNYAVALPAEHDAARQRGQLARSGLGAVRRRLHRVADGQRGGRRDPAGPARRGNADPGGDRLADRRGGGRAVPRVVHLARLPADGDPPGDLLPLVPVHRRARLHHLDVEVGVGVTMTEFGPRPVMSLPGEWTFWADTIVGRTAADPSIPLGPVDVAQFWCTSRLSGFGTGGVMLSLPCGLPSDRLLALWSWRLWCYYDNELYWCGVPSGISDENGSTMVNLTLTELPGYLKKRQWSWHPAWETPPGGMEQTAIARILADPVRAVGMRIETDPGPVPVIRDRRYEFLESDSQGQLLANLCGVENGPEFRTEYRTTEQGNPECILRIGYPRVGSGDAGLGVSIPGAALGYRAAWDSDQLRNWTYAVGDLKSDAPEGTPRPTVLRYIPHDGMPQLDAVDDWPGTFLESTLLERAETMLRTQAVPALQLTATPPESFPPITRYYVGDDVTVRAVTPLLPGGLDVTGRLAQIDVNAAEGTAIWTVTTPSPPPLYRETLTRRLDRLDTTMRQQFHSGPTSRDWPEGAADPDATGPQHPEEDR